MAPQEWVDEVQELASKLGGGWRIERGIMPTVVLTLQEARDLDRRIERLEDIDRAGPEDT